MNKSELKESLELINVNPRQYSLNGELNPDCIILYQNYVKWEVFYLDERGDRHDERIFDSENDACEYIESISKSVSVES